MICMISATAAALPDSGAGSAAESTPSGVAIVQGRPSAAAAAAAAAAAIDAGGSSPGNGGGKGRKGGRAGTRPAGCSGGCCRPESRAMRPGDMPARGNPLPCCQAAKEPCRPMGGSGGRRCRLRGGSGSVTPAHGQAGRPVAPASRRLRPRRGPRRPHEGTDGAAGSRHRTRRLPPGVSAVSGSGSAFSSTAASPWPLWPGPMLSRKAAMS